MVNQIKTAVNLGGIQMKNPINTAAGTFGYGWQFEGFYDVSQLGAITMKGVARVPWEGNPAPRMCELNGGMIIWKILKVEARVLSCRWLHIQCKR